MIFQTFEIVASFIESILGIIMPALLLKVEKIDRTKTFGVSVALTGVVWYINQYVLFSIFTTLVGILLMACGSCVLYKIKFRDTIVITGFYMMLIYINDFLAMSLLGVLLGMSDFAQLAILEVSEHRIYFLILSKSLLCVTCCFFKRIYKTFEFQREKTEILSLVTVLILYNSMNSTFAKTDLNSFLTWLLLLGLVLLGIYSIIQQVVATTQKERVEMEEELNRMLSENYEFYMNNQRKNQIFYHDLKNQYLILKEYMEKGEYEKASHHLNSLTMIDAIGKIQNCTGIEALDIIIENKRNRALMSDIQISLIIEKLRLPMKDSEVVALVGNLLDNAIEACRELNIEERRIQVVMREVRNISFIKVTNSYNSIFKKENGHFVTTKSEKSVHGIGMNSIRAIVEKYQGGVEINDSDGIFSVSISFFN